METYGNYPDLKAVKKILMIKLRHLGDVLLTCPVLHALKESVPGAEIDVYIYKEAFPIFQGHPNITRLIGYDRNWKSLGFLSRMAKEAKLLLDIRKRGYDLVIHLTQGDRGLIAGSVSGAKVRVGFRPNGKWKRRMLTHTAKDCPSLRHTVERNLDVLRRIGIFPSETAKDLYFHIPEKALEKVKALTNGEPFILIHPTSRWRFKCWPPENMRELVRCLLKEGKKVVITSGPDPYERAMVEEIARDLEVLNLSGALCLKELGALIAMSEVVVCVDSVSFHLANALKKKVIALFGPTSDVTWGPWRNPQARVISMPMSCRPCYLDGCGGSKRSDCMESLPVEKVLQSIYSALIPCLESVHNRKSSPK